MSGNYPPRLAIYPGSFDPVTNGHLDILRRARDLFDTVVLAVAQDSLKTGLLAPGERIEILREATAGMDGVEVESFPGLLVDYVRKRGARTIVRGLRAVADFEFEFQLALMNRQMAPEIDSVFLMTDQKNLYISSSIVKEIARLGGKISAFVPEAAERALVRRIRATDTHRAAKSLLPPRPGRGR